MKEGNNFTFFTKDTRFNVDKLLQKKILLNTLTILFKIMFKAIQKYLIMDVDLEHSQLNCLK